MLRGLAKSLASAFELGGLGLPRVLSVPSPWNPAQPTRQPGRQAGPDAEKQPRASASASIHRANSCGHFPVMRSGGRDLAVLSGVFWLAADWLCGLSGLPARGQRWRCAGWRGAVARAVTGLGWSGRPGGRAAGGFEQGPPFAFAVPVLWQVQGQLAAAAAGEAGGDVDQVGADGGAAGPGVEPGGQAPGARSRLQVIAAQVSHAAFAVNDPRWQVSQRAVGPVGEDLLDDGVVAVLFLSWGGLYLKSSLSTPRSDEDVCSVDMSLNNV